MKLRPATTETIALEERYRSAGRAMKVFPKRPDGLTTDVAKSTPEYRVAKAELDAAFAALRSHNELRRI